MHLWRYMSHSVLCWLSVKPSKINKKGRLMELTKIFKNVKYDLSTETHLLTELDMIHPLFCQNRQTHA